MSEQHEYDGPALGHCWRCGLRAPEPVHILRASSVPPAVVVVNRQQPTLIHGGRAVKVEVNGTHVYTFGENTLRPGVVAHGGPDGTWTVSDRGMWLDGIYATEETARRAAGLSDATLRDLGRIYRVDGENRPVTDADLDAVEEA